MKEEILVVASKVKAMIKNESGMSTSAGCMPVLTLIVKEECLKAIENARQDGRKTVMDRDFHKHS